MAGKQPLYLKFISLLMVMLFLSTTAICAEVIQGKCAEIDLQSKVLKIEIYDTTIDAENPYGSPTSESIQIDISESLVGITPNVGDVLRIAFNRQADINKAVRVMNITKQGLLNK